MVYKLTQKDIDEYNLQGALVGEEATPEDLRIMDQGLISTMQSAIDAAPDTMQVQPSPMSNPAADTGPQIGDPQFTETPAQAAAKEAAAATMSPTQSALLGGGAGVQGSNDPFANLSRTQRMMLAFSAIEDAGAALQGKKGGSFNETMKTFNEIRDMERKRQAQLAQVAANQQMLQAFGASTLPPNASAEQIDAHIAKMTSILATNPAAAPYVNAELARLQPMRERAASQAAQIQNINLGIAATDALLNSENLDQISGFDGTVNQFLEKFGAAPEYSSLMAYIDQLKGLNFLEAYQTLKGSGPVTDIEGDKATAARSRLERALKGNTSDLRGAIEDVGALFDEARMKNPQYQRQLEEQGSGIDPQLEDWYNKRLQTQQGGRE